MEHSGHAAQQLNSSFISGNWFLVPPQSLVISSEGRFKENKYLDHSIQSGLT